MCRSRGDWVAATRTTNGYLKDVTFLLPKCDFCITPNNCQPPLCNIPGRNNFFQEFKRLIQNHYSYLESKQGSGNLPKEKALCAASPLHTQTCSAGPKTLRTHFSGSAFYKFLMISQKPSHSKKDILQVRSSFSMVESVAGNWPIRRPLHFSTVWLCARHCRVNYHRVVLEVCGCTRLSQIIPNPAASGPFSQRHLFYSPREPPSTHSLTWMQPIISLVIVIVCWCFISSDASYCCDFPWTADAIGRLSQIYESWIAMKVREPRLFTWFRENLCNNTPDNGQCVLQRLKFSLGIHHLPSALSLR